MMVTIAYDDSSGIKMEDRIRASLEQNGMEKANGRRMMGKKKIIAAILFTFSFLFVMGGCGSEESTSDAVTPVKTTIRYSNLTEEETGKELSDVMKSAGISDARQAVFFDHVRQFNSAVSAESLTQGFEEADITCTKYDPYEMQEEWMAAFPDFLGYNCRITAYSLMGDHIDIPADARIRDDMVLMDVAALEEDDSALLYDGDLQRFQALFSTVPTEGTKETAVHVEKLQQDWKRRGIRFRENENARLITVLFHENIYEGKDYLFVGHTGVLMPADDGTLYFVEKIAFQEPYQLTVFQSRGELKDYLMTKYDVSEDQPTAAPFIMENDRLMEGY